MAFSGANAAETNGLFTAELVDRFKIMDFSPFLGSDKPWFQKDNLGGVLFEERADYVAGATLRHGYRQVGIAVFKSHEAAIAAVEYRRRNVAAPIEIAQKPRNGVADWWFCEWQALLDIVQDNLVFEVGDIHGHYSKIEKELWNTAIKFLKEVKPSTSSNPKMPVR